jgi:hypothetical protein
MALFLDAIPENEDTCFICSRTATTAEHVIPKWLQRRFNLWDQRLGLPNRTSLRYRQLLIPACTKCNTGALAQLEREVESGGADERAIWRWLNKIHYGLGYKDRVLQWDRAHPGLRIGDVANSTDPFERDRHFLHCVSGDFAVDPDPFGSIFRFDFETEQPFMLAHNVHSASLSISLGRTGWVGFVTDGQALKRDVATQETYRTQSSRDGGLAHMLFFHAQGVEHLARHALGQDIMMTDRFMIRVGRTVVHSVTPPSAARFKRICDSLGLDWEDGEPEGRYRLKERT